MTSGRILDEKISNENAWNIPSQTQWKIGIIIGKWCSKKRAPKAKLEIVEKCLKTNSALKDSIPKNCVKDKTCVNLNAGLSTNFIV